MTETRQNGGTDRATPELSVILPTSGTFESVRRTLAMLGRQTVAERLEVVVVAPELGVLGREPAELGAFGATRLVESGRGGTIAAGYGAGIRAARAPLVALAEDHCFPAPGWAAALIETHRGEWAAVGPVIRNANPATLVSWCDFLIGYGPWMEPKEGGDVEMLPGHNSSYKRDVLLGYGARLESMLAAESVMHADLRARGERLRLEPAAVTDHLNFALISSWIPVQFLAGRVYGAARASGWGIGRRAAFTLGSPLIPFVRLRRILLWATPRQVPGASRIRLVPLLLLGLMIDALGQMAGYAAGAGGAAGKLARFEFERVDHLPESDCRMVARQYPIAASLLSTATGSGDGVPCP